MKWTLPAGAAALALIAGGAWYMTQSTPAPGNSQIALPGAASAQTSDVDTSEITEMVLGNRDATVEVIEYAAFTCPHCGNFHKDAFKDLKKDYIDTGKIKFVYREVYFHKYGMWASLIARCGGEEKFFGIVDLVYKSQQIWSRAGSEGEVADELRKIGRVAGMDTEQLDACLADGDKLQSLLGWYQQNAQEHNIESTPSFVINGERHSNMGYAEFSALLDEKLAE